MEQGLERHAALNDATTVKIASREQHCGEYGKRVCRGNVGIGTSNPESPLDLADAVRISSVGHGAEVLNPNTERRWAFRQLNSGSGPALELASIGGGGNKSFVINTIGSVGIGTGTPSFTLHVNGTAGKLGGGSVTVR